ncbi:hypothetical protein KY347_01615 [Candidatus Woesearchaeota archaeon]|nr:hypothetical protein [Candidatus Woesearchaeota archaeon]
MENKKEDVLELFRDLPKRKLSEMEKQVIFILIERSKIQREHSSIILNKGFIIFLAFLVVAYFGRVNVFIPDMYINVLFVLGVMLLVTAMWTYQVAIDRERKILEKLLDSFLK